MSGERRAKGIGLAWALMPLATREQAWVCISEGYWRNLVSQALGEGTAAHRYTRIVFRRPR